MFEETKINKKWPGMAHFIKKSSQTKDSSQSELQLHAIRQVQVHQDQYCKTFFAIADGDTYYDKEQLS